ncbi:DUF2079 domain-containing protein [Candidatus Woesebacteria bacterium]|nr:DUF2079 domain-containing protein [Candidatus Woesebacteria bacterium]
MLRKLIKTIIPGKTEALLWLMVSVAIIVFCAKSMGRYERLSAYYFDLGIMHQVVANTAHGHFLEITDPNFYTQGNRLGYHFDFILAFFAPFYIFFNDARVLLAGQSIIIGLGALPLFLLAKDHLKSKKFALSIAALYLLYYPIHATIIADFHSVTLATTFILWTWYGMEKKKYALVWTMVILAWFTKENVPLITGAIGFYFFLKGDRRHGGTLFALSGAWFLLVYKGIMPYFRTGQHFAESYYSSNIVENLMRLFSEESFKYLYLLTFPLLFIPFLAPQFLLLALPEWLIILLSSNENMRQLQYHYTALLTPFIFIALIYGLKKVAHKKIFIVILLLVQCSLLFTRSNLLKPYPANEDQLRIVNVWQEKLKDPRIPVATSGHLASHFSGRRYFYNFFYDFAYWQQGITDEQIDGLISHYEKAEYVLIKESELDITDERVMRYYFHLVTNPAFEKVFDESGIEVYKKVYNQET